MRRQGGISATRRTGSRDVEPSTLSSRPFGIETAYTPHLLRPIRPSPLHLIRLYHCAGAGNPAHFISDHGRHHHHCEGCLKVGQEAQFQGAAFISEPSSSSGRKAPSGRRANSTWRLLSWTCSAALFLLAYLTYKNDGQLPTHLLRPNSRHSHPPPTHQQHPFSPPPSRSDASNDWNKQAHLKPPTDKRAPSLAYPLPPTRPLPEQPLRAADKDRHAAVLAAFNHSWSAYRRDAWGYDEYHPISSTAQTSAARRARASATPSSTPSTRSSSSASKTSTKRRATGSRTSSAGTCLAG